MKSPRPSQKSPASDEARSSVAEVPDADVHITRRHYYMLAAFAIGFGGKVFFSGIPAISGHVWDIALPFILYYYFHTTRKRRDCVIGAFTVCTLGEFVQLIPLPNYLGWLPVVNGTFDWWDIASYGVGVTLALLLDIAFPPVDSASKAYQQ